MYLNVSYYVKKKGIKSMVRNESADVLIVIESLERKKTCLFSLQYLTTIIKSPQKSYLKRRNSIDVVFSNSPV